MSKPIYSPKTRLIGYVFCAIAGVTAFGLAAPNARADTSYNNGSYGDCSYEATCPTIVTIPTPSPNPSPNPTTSPSPSPSPLEVSINLHDGQVIPSSGYTIIVTPLNGAGNSFEQVQFYIGGSLLQSMSPAEDGTASWFWDVSKNPGTQVKIVITGAGGQTVTQNFQVVMGQAGAASSAPTPRTQSLAAVIIQQIISAPTKIVQGIQHNLTTLQHGVAKLPSPVKYSLPYFLFLVLAVDLALLGVRARHEITESNRLNELLSREKRDGELKNTFLELIQHYFRTPLTLINSSFDLAGSTADASVAAGRQTAQRLKTAIDNLLNSTPPDPSAQQPEPALHNPSPLWRSPSLYLPVVLIGLVAFFFDYLVHHTNGYSITQVNLIVQIVTFGSMSVVIYLLFRYRQLKAKERAQSAHVLQTEVNFNRDRDEVIAYGATQINKLADTLSDQINKMSNATVKKTAAEGAKRLQRLTTKLLLANELKGSHSLQPYTAVDLQTIVDRSLAQLLPEITNKQASVKVLQNRSFQTQNQGLLVQVMRTVLDNAIAYGQQGGSIEVEANVADSQVILTVTDHGPGIAPDKKFLLFQAFSKTEGAEVFNHEGMGFSLYLDKLIMNYLVGDIWVDSIPGRGTKVSLKLAQPLTPSAGSTIPAASQPSTT